MLRPAFLALFLAGLALSACSAPPESRVALSDPAGAAYDERLLGIWSWIGEDGDGAFFLHIEAKEGTVFLDVVGTGIGYEEGDPVRWIRATAHASEIDGEIYYNVQRISGGDGYTAEGEQPGFIILQVEISGQDTLDLRFMDHSLLRDLIEEGRVEGREVEGDYRGEEVPYIMLDLSRPELHALIREVGAEELFGEQVGPFYRLSPHTEMAEAIERPSEG